METMAQRCGSIDVSFHLPNFPHMAWDGLLALPSIVIMPSLWARLECILSHCIYCTLVINKLGQKSIYSIYILPSPLVKDLPLCKFNIEFCRRVGTTYQFLLLIPVLSLNQWSIGFSTFTSLQPIKMSLNYWENIGESWEKSGKVGENCKWKIRKYSACIYHVTQCRIFGRFFPLGLFPLCCRSITFAVSLRRGAV